MIGLIKKYILWTYLLFFAFILLIGLVMFVFKSEPVAGLLQGLSAWTATIVFVVMFRKIYPQGNLIEFIKEKFRKKVKITTVLCIIFLQLFLLGGSLLIIKFIWNVSISEQVTASWVTLLILFGSHIILGPLGEELGWRGFVLDELQKRFSPLKSSIIVGVGWGFWHAPLWFIASEYSGLQLVQYIICFIVSIIAVSIIITVFYNLNHNLVIPILIHQLFNFFLAIQVRDLLPILTVTAFLYLAVAVVLIVINGNRRGGYCQLIGET
ncbi:CPBP family intramembrane glutamic endopeptidase [Bacillus horti]|uniref:Membrane protease YdiL (CAAX protease family) n=1 Tax=Caldalkalibacillus horti TaxID=77523 RepID=A0ABT9W1R1_9BACI|nr:type II CAAX endopeptidase family protein [Bacillus horti]MDQ0167187.1 membrane protease YdiL (CAAX protease family) [Bacillus horti]